jgi:RNA polymerase sigma-70 factor (ECF subfamily)
MENIKLNSYENSNNTMSKWQGWLFGFYKNKGIKFNDASDLVQNVLIKIHQNLDTIEPKKQKAWITSVASNELADYFRRNSKIKTVHDQENIIKTKELKPEEKMEHNEEIEQIKELLSELSENHFEIIDLYYFQNLTKPEIAKKLEIPLGTVKSRIFSALETLKQKMK